MRPTTIRETATGSLITQRSQVRNRVPPQMSHDSSRGPHIRLLSIVVPKALKDPHAAKTDKSVAVYSTPITGNRPELSGSGRSCLMTNNLVAQEETGNNRNSPDL
jgi:hypothetical protein